jgi:hypothetical protein
VLQPAAHHGLALGARHPAAQRLLLQLPLLRGVHQLQRPQQPRAPRPAVLHCQRPARQRPQAARLEKVPVSSPQLLLAALRQLRRLRLPGGHRPAQHRLPAHAQRPGAARVRGCARVAPGPKGAAQAGLQQPGQPLGHLAELADLKCGSAVEVVAQCAGARPGAGRREQADPAGPQVEAVVARRSACSPPARARR